MRLRILAVLMVLLPRPILAQEVSVAITSSARPFFYTDDQGNPAGFNPELAELLCQHMGRSCTLEPTTFPHLIAGIEQGAYQIGFGNMLKTPEREQKMLFSAPIWRSTTSFITAADAPVIVPEQVKAKAPVCAVHKSQQETFLANLEGPPENLVSLPGFAALFTALEQGRCAAALVPTANALDFLTSAAGQGFDYSGPPLQSPQLSGTVHIVVSKGHPELVEALNKAIAAITLDGSYRRLIAHHFPFDIL